jgi:hypothetical protein
VLELELGYEWGLELGLGFGLGLGLELASVLPGLELTLPREYCRR